MQLAPKMGRPTTNPKPHKMAIRLDDECKRILDEYCEQEEVSQNEAARRGIRKLDADIKK